MEYTGLITKYPVNRPLTHEERELHLHQRTAIGVAPHYQLSVIKMNSTFLESVDKWFGWKGAATAVAIIAMIMSVGTTGHIAALETLSVLGFAGIKQTGTPSLAGAIAFSVLTLIAAGMCGWFLCRESFAYTHYPIRFNRKSRLVHVVRLDGTVLTKPWDEIFFTMGHLPQWNEWEIRGHILAGDKNTVLETFPLSYVGTFHREAVKSGKTATDDYVSAHWEFIRRYMEEGPESVSSQVQFCMPVDQEKESVSNSFERVFANIAAAPIALRWLLWPWCFLVACGRVLAMRTCKIPRFPAEIEAECAVEADDPYAIRGDVRGERIAVFPAAAAAAGVRFIPPTEAKV